jgi:hypothetical protein
MPRKKKLNLGAPSKFDALDQEFKDSIAAMSRKDIRERVATIALDQATLMGEKENDQDFLRARERSRDAGAIYREGTKLNKLRIEYAKQVLGDKGA